MANLSRKEACNILEKYTDISLCKDVIEAHNMAIDALSKTCKNCLNSNPHMVKTIDGKKCTFCDNLQIYMEIDKPRDNVNGCWFSMWENSRN